MRTVWKSKINLEAIQEVEIPEGAELLQFSKQGSRWEDDINLWYLCETDNKKITRTFALLETGAEIPDGFEYVGTIWLLSGSHVLHLFELRKE